MKKAELLEEIELFECQLDEVKRQIKETPKHISFGELEDKDKFQRLRPGRKQLIGTVRMVAYRAETAMAGLLRSETVDTATARQLLIDLLPLRRNASKVTMHIEHKAGDKMFVDYAGDKLVIVDRKGKERSVEVFVAILGANRLTYAEASFSQKSEDWIRSNERAFIYCGGVTQAIVPDNLKSGVTQSNRYEPGINLMFDDFADHYQTVILPARVCRPQDKALVENAVNLVYQRIYAPLRNRIFYSLEELNEAMWDLLEQHNNIPFQRLKTSRRELFDNIEKQVLKPLPKERYAIKQMLSVIVLFTMLIE